MTNLPVRIAMWSGPRNISTAMMRAFENRADCTVVDEPFYASYLHRSGVVHPMQDEILASQPLAVDDVIKALQAPVDTAVQYQKHMTHHMALPLPTAWLQTLRHAFLIRHPADMIASYVNKRAQVTADDVGSEAQVVIFDAVTAATGTAPPVIDAQRFLADPARGLRMLCDRLGIEFDPAMLRWPTGLRDSDGVWAPHWYNAVAGSTGFGRYSRHDGTLAKAEQAVVDACLPHYEHLLAHAL